MQSHESKEQKAENKEQKQQKTDEVSKVFSLSLFRTLFSVLCLLFFRLCNPPAGMSPRLARLRRFD